MMRSAGSGTNIMQYVRELEAKLIQCRQIQGRFKAQSFALGTAFGILITLAWEFFLTRRPF